MSETIPFVGFGYDDNRQLCAVVGPNEYTSLDALLNAAPFIAAPEHILLLAGALNHFDQGMGYGVITEIEPYKADFLRRYAEEEDLEWDQFNLRVGDFELPDFDQMTPPSIKDGQIRFFVNHRGLDAPYEVTGPADGSGKLDYSPL